MKNKKIIIYSLFSLQLIVFFSPSNVNAQTINLNTTAAISSTISPRVDDIDWQYTVIDNVLYRRLYNYSTKTALSDWEIVP